MEITEINKLTADVIATPLKIIKKGQFVLSVVRRKHVVVHRLCIVIQFLLTSLNMFKDGKTILLLTLPSAVAPFYFIKRLKIIQTRALLLEDVGT